MLIIRPAASGDREGAAAVSACAARELRRVYRQQKRRRSPWECAQVRARELVALLEGEVVGTVRCLVTGDHIEIERLAVHPEYRHQGIARRLIESACRTAQDGGMEHLALHTSEESGNVSIFEHLGFHVVSPAPVRTDSASGTFSDAQGGLEDVYMELDVAPPGGAVSAS